MRNILAFLGVVLAMLSPATLAGTGASSAPPAPAFTHLAQADWLNASPLTWERLRGQVVLLEFWTFACWNCDRSIPWVQDLQKRLGPRGLRIVSVHTPELARERVRANVVESVAKRGITYPVMLDDDYSFWNALGNQYWPAFYLVDKQGRVRASYAGETHTGDAQARTIEDALVRLLGEAAP